MVKLSQPPGQLEKQISQQAGTAMCTNSNSTWDWGPREVTSLAWEVKEGLKAEKMRRERRGNQAEGTGGCTWQARADTGVGGV